jgi:hypothetical protein
MLSFLRAMGALIRQIPFSAASCHNDSLDDSRLRDNRHEAQGHRLSLDHMLISGKPDTWCLGTNGSDGGGISDGVRSDQRDMVGLLLHDIDPRPR